MGEGRSEREIAKFSVKDAQRYSAVLLHPVSFGLAGPA
jgi:hypothetical protein